MSTQKYAAPLASGYDRDSIHLLAEATATALKYRPGGSLEDIVSKLGGRISYLDLWELDDPASGSIRIENEASFEIFLPLHTGPMRDRFTIAHEIGHYVLHYLMAKVDGKNVGPIEANRYGSGRVEFEANWFAAAFLMPEEIFKRKFAEFDKDILDLSSFFGVSYQAAEIRARSLSLSS